MLNPMKLPQKIKAWSASAAHSPLELKEFPFPALGAEEVALEVAFCGVCHSDLHLIDDDWKISSFPLVPGHEIMGKVIAAGPKADFKTGQWVGVGWQSSSCGRCEDCRAGRENLCDSPGATCVGHLGGYADFHVTHSRFCFPLPESLAKPEVAPLLCGGITVYSPIKEILQGSGRSVAVVGMGGLGHLAVKFASALGHEVSVFSSSLGKKAEALAMGASHFLASGSREEIESAGRRHDLVLVTANADLPYSSYLETLRSDGTLCFVGIPPSPLNLSVGQLLGKRLRVTASPIGSPSRIREMLELALEKGLGAQTEIFPLEKVNEVLPMVKENRVRYRAVLARM
jgi:alcohol/geraniol dehydrogenase (NADP+)